MSDKATRLSRAAALGGLIAAALALGAQSAAASTIHACVSKRSDAVRIVSAKTKCRRGESKAAWNTTGPAGPAGAPGSPGAAGTNGTNGVGVDYASKTFGPVSLAEDGKGAVVVAETIPAGSYFVNAKTVLIASKGKSAVTVAVICQLVDTSGTPAIVEPPGGLDTSDWFQSLSQNGSEWEAIATLPLQAQLTTTEATTLAVICVPVIGSKEAQIEAGLAEVSALQTTANK